MKYFLTLIFLLFSLQVFAADASSSNTMTHGGALFQKKIPVTLEFVATHETMKDRSTHEPNGDINKLDVSLLYAASAKDEFRLYSSAFNINEDGESPDNHVQLVEAMYRRKYLLTESQHGLDLNLELKSYNYAEPMYREFSGANGAFVPQLVFSKKLSRRLHLSGKIREMFYYRRNSDTETLENGTRIYLTPTVVLMRKLFFNANLIWKHEDRVGTTKVNHRQGQHYGVPEELDYLQFIPSLMYIVNRSMLMEVYADTKIMKSHDGSTFSKTAADEAVYGLSMYVTAF